MPLGSSAATNDLSGLLQKGLFEEEANRNLEAAAQAYSTVSAQFDKDRKLAATAIFRLGEIYRKQGKTNEAAGQYERIVREFVDQDTLVTLSRQNIAGLQSPENRNRGSGRLASLDEVRASIERFRQRIASYQALPETNRLDSLCYLFRGDDPIDFYCQDTSRLKQHLKALLLQYSQPHPEVMKAQAELKALEEKIEARAKESIQRIIPVTAQLEKELQRRESLEIASDVESKSFSPVATTDDEEKEIRRIQAMIQNSPDLINAPNATGLTPLHTAANQGQLTVARFLLDNKANVNARNSNSETPLTLAALQGHKAMVELLLSRDADVNAQGSGGYTALHYAARRGFNALAETLLANHAEIDARSQAGTTPLHLAAVDGHSALAESLLNRRADVNAVDKSGQTPLFNAALAGHSAMLKVLLAAKAKVDPVDNNGRTALSYAAEKGHVDSVQALLAAKADPNLGQRDLPLASAVKAGHLEIAETLLRGGANPNLAAKFSHDVRAPGDPAYPRDIIGTFGPYLPLQIAVADRNVPMVKLLLKYKADATAIRLRLRSLVGSGWF